MTAGDRAARRLAGGAGGDLGAGDRSRRAHPRAAAGAGAGRRRARRWAGRRSRSGALAERAALAHDRIVDGLGGEGGPEGRRLARLAEQVTREVLALAVRCRKLRGELERIDVAAVRERAGQLTRPRRTAPTRPRAPI
jgi:hypothetical protein